MTEPRQGNRLAHETSPYLLQHAHNPVDWYPWGEEAFQRARAENRPILLSVGYSACHWCHVMERESFENPDIAALMNAHFVNVKVDREERPDVDAIYMSAVQLMTGQGGWPMTMFLTPEGKPFYGGTYFPPMDMYGRPGFPRILEAIATAWKTERIGIEAQSETILSHLEQGNDLLRDLPDTLLVPTLLETAFDGLSTSFDRTYGGFGTSPKFPQPANIDFLLRFHARSKRQEPLAMAEKTLQKMALGGMYDQLGGGFHRYSTDQTWLVPHFEKMLYDNAQLAQTYAHAYQITGKAFYRGIAEEILEYVLREMTGDAGEFYSAQDADSEGEEGKYFVWTPQEVRAATGEFNANVFCAFYDVTEQGNWSEHGAPTGQSILHRVADIEDLMGMFGTTHHEVTDALEGARTALFNAREQRIKPGLDDKTLTAWNGLMLAAFAECGAIFGREDFIAAAIKNAKFVSTHLYKPGSKVAKENQTEECNIQCNIQGQAEDREENQRENQREGQKESPNKNLGGGLLRTYRNGQAKLNAYLEDYAFYADGLLHLYQATFDTRWLEMAHNLVDNMLDHFWDEQHAGFFTTSNDHETLIQRPKDLDDNATPSGNSVAIELLIKLHALTGDERYQRCAARVLRKLAPMLAKHPYGFARLLGALDLYLAQPLEIGIVGAPDDPATLELRTAAFKPYLPNKVVALTPLNSSPTPIAFMEGRPAIDGKPTAYVCTNFTCKAPVTSAEELLALL